MKTIGLFHHSNLKLAYPEITIDFGFKKGKTCYQKFKNTFANVNKTRYSLSTCFPIAMGQNLYLDTHHPTATAS